MPDAEPAVEPAADPQPAAPAGPLDGLVSMAIEGIAAYAASMVRDGLSRLISGHTGDKGAEQKPGGGSAPLLLAVAVAAVVTVLLAGRGSAQD